jgi:hypothetical protein
MVVAKRLLTTKHKTQHITQNEPPPPYPPAALPSLSMDGADMPRTHGITYSCVCMQGARRWVRPRHQCWFPLFGGTIAATTKNGERWYVMFALGDRSLIDDTTIKLTK